MRVLRKVNLGDLQEQAIREREEKKSVPQSKSVTRRVAAQSNNGRPTPKQIQETFGDVAESRGGEPIPAGTYELRVIEANVQVSGSGDPYVSFTAVVTSGEFEGRKVFGGMFLNTEKPDGSKSNALGMTRALLADMLGGVPPEMLAISKYDKDSIAAAIVEAIENAEWEARVSVQEPSDDDKKLGFTKSRNRIYPK